MTDRNTIRALKQILEEGFGLEDLHDLCFWLDVDEKKSS